MSISRAGYSNYFSLVGEEMCYQLSKMGSKLILSSRNEEKLEEVKSKLAHPEDAR